MKNLKEYLLESKTEDDNVYVVYFDDGTMDNYYDTEEEAEEQKKKLNTEAPSNKCTVKKEPRTNFEAK